MERREFLTGVGLLAAGATTTAETPKEKPPALPPELAAVRAQLGSIAEPAFLDRLTPEQLADVAGQIAGDQANARALDRVLLVNGDAPVLYPYIPPNGRG